MNTAEVVKLLRRLAPHELRGVMVYVVHKQGVPASLGGACSADGWTSPVLDLTLRPVIAERWRGRGVCLVADGEGRQFDAVCIHELAHAIDRPQLFSDLPAWLTVNEMAEHTARQLSGNDPTTAMTAEHSPRWCRLALHLACRAGRLNHGPALADVFGYPHLIPFAYPMVRVLEDEIEQHADAPLRQLDSVPTPTAFTDLWSESTAWCHELENRNPTPSEPTP